MPMTENNYLRLNNEVLNKYRSTGELDLAIDKESTRRYFLESINQRLRSYINTEDKISYLVEEGYYEGDFLEAYTPEFIEEIYQLVFSYKHRFPSFMSASKFYEGYAMKSRNETEILERLEDRVAINALYLSRGDENLARKAAAAIMDGLQPATPTFLNSGKVARGELVSCYKLTMDDSMRSIARNIDYALELSRLGGGVGINLTDLRPMGDPIKGIINRASGVMPVAKLMENSFSYANQLGQRNGSGVAYLNIFHGDIESFISSKKSNADEKIRLATLSTGVVIPRKFFELMEKGLDMVLFSPYDILREYGKRMSEISITEMYNELLENPNIRKLKRLNARKLYTEIKKVQSESGFPFEINDDNMNEQHPLKKLGRVKMSNLCTEIMQVQTTSHIGNYGEEDEIGIDVSCNLSSIDIHRASKVKDFKDFIETAVRVLTNVSIMSEVINVPSVMEGNNKMHAIGLGAMNMHGHLITSDIDYESEEAIEFTDRFFEAMNFYSLYASAILAKEKKEVFYGYELSDYATGEYFYKYITKENVEPSEKVKAALGNIPIITSEMWRDLKDFVKRHGVYNAYRMAVAPTGSISYIRSCTASIAPITERVEIRDYADSRTIYPMPFLTTENQEKYKEAYDINQYRMIDLYAAAQKHVDQGISMTLYITNKWSTQRIAHLYYYAEKQGIKSVYYVRQRVLKIEDEIQGGFLREYEEKKIDECEQCSI